MLSQVINQDAKSKNCCPVRPSHAEDCQDIPTAAVAASEYKEAAEYNVGDFHVSQVQSIYQPGYYRC